MAKINKSNAKIIEPLIVYHLIFVHSPNPLNWLKFDPSPLWYLVSLCCWKYMTLSFIKSSKRYLLTNANGWGKFQTLILFALSLTLSMFAFLAVNKYEYYLSIMRTFLFFPFFMLGYALQGKIELFKSKRVLWLVLSLILLVGVFLIWNFSGSKINAIFFCKDGIIALSGKLGMSLFQTFVVKYSMMFISIVIALWILFYLKIPKMFSMKGKTTLFILCTHSILYPLCARYCHNTALALAIAITTVLILSILAESKYNTYFMYPYTKLRMKRNRHE